MSDRALKRLFIAMTVGAWMIIVFFVIVRFTIGGDELFGTAGDETDTLESPATNVPPTPARPTTAAQAQGPTDMPPPEVSPTEPSRTGVPPTPARPTTVAQAQESTDTPIPSTDSISGPLSLVASAACNLENLEVTITAGDGLFNITANAGVNTPVNGVDVGTMTINGPEKWDDLTVVETAGDRQSINLGQFRCRSDEFPVPLTPSHRSRTTNAFPLFSWLSITHK